MARQPKGQNCDNCRYSGSWTPEDVAACRRYPPVIDPTVQDEDGDYYGAWPRTYSGSWCGEWSPENPETVSEAATTLARLVLLGDRTAAYALVDKLKE